MTNFIFKSSKGLLKKSDNKLEADLIYVSRQLAFIQSEQRAQRADLQELKRMVNKLIVDKHLKFEVDNYFERQEHDIPDSGDLD